MTHGRGWPLSVPGRHDSATKEKGRGGAEGNRTPDLCSAIAALSHLSYGPATGGLLASKLDSGNGFSDPRALGRTKSGGEDIWQRPGICSIVRKDCRRWTISHGASYPKRRSRETSFACAIIGCLLIPIGAGE